jgi:DivIVA domain-containing protein
MSHRRFRRVRRLRKGYSPRQVDAFVNSVEISLSGMIPPITATEIRRAGFELVHGGYRVEEVDAYLDVLEEKVIARPRAGGGRRGRPDPAAEIEYLRTELGAASRQRFPRAERLHRGYAVEDVDEFVDRLLAALDQGRQVTAADIRKARFRPQRHGYAEDAVDDTLDRVIELVLLLASTPAVGER